MFAASLAQLFPEWEHLFGCVDVPQPPAGGFKVGRSHLYQASLTVAYQNFSSLALIESEQRAASSPKLLADVLSIPIGEPAMFDPDDHYDQGIYDSSNYTTSVLRIFAVSSCVTRKY